MSEEKKTFNQFNYINEYQKNNYDRIAVLSEKGTKDKIKAITGKDKKYKSVNDFINAAISEKLKRMKIDN